MNTERHSNWSITINNPISADEEEIARARQRGWKVEGQLEKGENGTPHYQLLVSTGQVRFSAVKKAFSRAHIEPARNVAALKQYVHKEKTKEGELPVQSEKYPSLSKFWKLVINEMLYGFDKEGLDYIAIYDRNLKLYRRDEEEEATMEELTNLYYRAVESLIYQGYYVEQYASNPLNKSSFNKYGKAILIRAFNELEDEKTASQTDTNENDLHTSDDEEYTPDANEIQEVNIPCLPLTPSFYTSLPPPQTPPKGDDASSEEGDSSSR